MGAQEAEESRAPSRIGQEGSPGVTGPPPPPLPLHHNTRFATPASKNSLPPVRELRFLLLRGPWPWLRAQAKPVACPRVSAGPGCVLVLGGTSLSFPGRGPGVPGPQSIRWALNKMAEPPFLPSPGPGLDAQRPRCPTQPEPGRPRPLEELLSGPRTQEQPQTTGVGAPGAGGEDGKEASRGSIPSWLQRDGPAILVRATPTEPELTPTPLLPSAVQPGTGRASEQPLKEAGSAGGPSGLRLAAETGDRTQCPAVPVTHASRLRGLTSGGRHRQGMVRTGRRTDTQILRAGGGDRVFLEPGSSPRKRKGHLQNGRQQVGKDT